MASREEGARSATPAGNDDGFPQFPDQPAGPPSIISSRMTDIASEDGGDGDAQRSNTDARRSGLASEAMSRPGTARTGMSSGRGAVWNQAQPLRKGLAGKRGSTTASLTSSVGGRPVSSAGKSHVPSLTSHAFFRPMSSQKLQAQRGASRPSTMHQQLPPPSEGSAAEPLPDGQRQSLASNPVARFSPEGGGDAENRPPPSRGTEMTEQETYDRLTANTSPTHGHYPAASVSESVRPLQKNQGGLRVEVDKGSKSGNLTTPLKSPRSFRSSFLLPSRGDSSQQQPPRRDMEGGEKLDSVVSTPRIRPGDDKNPSKIDKVKAKLGHNYEYFEGNTVFCLGGRLQNTRHQPVNIATGVATVIPAVLFFIFSAPWLWANFSPAVPITWAYVWYIAISSFIHGSASDPGILPRNLHRFPPADENEDPLRLAPPTNDWVLVKSAESSTAAMEVPTKFCKTCNVWRPPRAHHCRLCDNCVETQDHHCVWLNNCIGRRNYRYFFTYVASVTVLSIYLFAISLAQLIVYSNQQGISFGSSIDHFRVPFALLIYALIGGLYPAALMGYHLFLMARGETTREYLNSHKFLKKDRYRAFAQRNWFVNWFVVLCRPRPPTYYRFKHQYAQGDQRLGSKRVVVRKAGSRDEMEMQDVKPQSESRQPGFEGPVALRGAQQSETA